MFELKRRHLALLLVVAAVALAGCGGMLGDDGDAAGTETDGPDETANGTDGTSNESDDSSTPNASTLQSNAVAALESVDGYEYRASMTSEQGNETYNQTEHTVVDEEERRLGAEATVETQFGNQTTEEYIDNRTRYVLQQGRWQTGQIGADFWNETFLLSQFRQPLESDNATVEGTDTIDGTDVYVLEVEPSTDELEEQLNQGAQGVQIEYEELVYTFYIDQETDLVQRTEIRESFTQNGQEGSATSTMTVEYDSSVSVEIPDAATGNESDA